MATVLEKEARIASLEAMVRNLASKLVRQGKALEETDKALQGAKELLASLKR